MNEVIIFHDDYIETEDGLYYYDYNLIKFLNNNNNMRCHPMRENIFIHALDMDDEYYIVSYKEFQVEINSIILDCSITDKLIIFLHPYHISIYNKELCRVKDMFLKFKPKQLCLSTDDNIILFEEYEIHSIPIEN